ncbi:hypothetical protein IGI37_002583 [Enterococcus sp. AZ194]|uniref:HAMP domain-containing sensor histidine kinase n=1 Tax=Enterococcus sp. AZ194 TaxID=2774629 RepID=UPI003F20FE24
MKKSLIYQLITSCYLSCLLAVFILFLVMDSKILFLPILLITGPFMLLIIYTVQLIKKKIIFPLDDLTREVERIEQGDLTNKIHSSSADEIGRFISAFDNMREALYKQQKKQDSFEKERKNFVTSISHDLKTPLSSLYAYVEALQDNVLTTEEEKMSCYKQMENKLSILMELSSNLNLSYETPEDIELSLESVNCYLWATDFLDDLSSECHLKNIPIQITNQLTTQTTSRILIDGYQLDRALLNLTSNAFRHYETWVKLSTSIENGRFVLRIKNDGAKVKTTNINQLFERFYTEEEPNEQGHLGLGLSIAKTLIQSMNGTIAGKQIDDQIEFNISFPLE